jgi:hypothetical protein
MKGLEPSTFAMARRRSSQLSYIRASRKCNAIEGPLEAVKRALCAHPLNVERPASPNGSSRARTAARKPASAAWRANA